MMKNSSADGPTCASRVRTVSIEYDFVAVCSSTSETAKVGSDSTASFTMAYRWLIGANDAGGLWGGSPDGINST